MKTKFTSSYQDFIKGWKYLLVSQIESINHIYYVPLRSRDFLRCNNDVGVWKLKELKTK